MRFGGRCGGSLSFSLTSWKAPPLPGGPRALLSPAFEGLFSQGQLGGLCMCITGCEAANPVGVPSLLLIQL